MALELGDRRAIERWVGPLEQTDLVDIEKRLVTLGHPLVVAYEILSIRYAALLSSPDELRIEGDARVRWVEAKKQLAVQLATLLAAIRTLENLNSAAEELLAPSLLSAGGSVISARRDVVYNGRP